MGLVDKIKNDVKKSGQNRGKFIFFREGQKARVRFLDDMDDGLDLPFHDSFERSINVPCQELFGRSCEFCDDEDLRHRSLYCWSVWDYEAKEVKLFMFPVNNCSPIPALMAMYETYGTICDRDYVISVSGKQTNKTYSVVPMDKAKFRNTKAKPYSESQVLKMLDKAYPADNNSDDDDDEPKRKRKPSKPAKSDDDWGDDDYDAPEEDYSEMSAKELFELCEERGIDAEKRKPQKYYIRLLEEYDNAQDDWGDDDSDDDDWEEE